MTYAIHISLDSFPQGEKVDKNFVFLSFTSLEPLCLGNVFFSPKWLFAKMCMFAVP